MIKILSMLGIVLIPTIVNAQVNVFTDHQAIYMVQHGVNTYQDVQFPTGNVPYLGRIGLEYEQSKNVSYSLSFIHRSNVDLINQDEYNYNGVSLGIKFTHCIYNCS